jgi:hypothetical protein
LIGAALALAGCAVQPVTDITLSGVVRGEQTVLTGPVPQSFVQFVRNGASYTTINPGMVMQPGDTLSTDSDTSVVITYPSGTRAYVYPNSQVRIGSVYNDRGNVFIKAKGAFKVRTKFLTAGSEGTQYWVDVKMPDQVKVVVVEDAVSLVSNAAIWPALMLRAGYQAVLRGASAPLLNAANAADIQRETTWVNRIDQLVPVQTSISPSDIFGPFFNFPPPISADKPGSVTDRQSNPTGTGSGLSGSTTDRQSEPILRNRQRVPLPPIR